MAAPGGIVSILFVDDEEDIAQSYAALLEAIYGWKVTCARSGREALKFLRAQAFDVIVSDYRMPAMSGVELLRRVQQLVPRTPFIMLTAYGDADLEAASFDAGATRFLVKSQGPRDIAAAILDAVVPGPGSGTRTSPRPPKGRRPSEGRRRSPSVEGDAGQDVTPAEPRPSLEMDPVGLHHESVADPTSDLFQPTWDLQR